MMKLSDNPPILSPSVKSLTELSGRWWVAHTKARNEKALAWDLQRLGIGYFLPMVEQPRVYNGKKQPVLLPLFSSYVFFCGSDSDRYNAMTTNHLCQTIEVKDQETIIKELVAIEKALADKVHLDPYPFAVIGQRCRIMAGTQKGTEGIVVERTQKARFVLQVGILCQGTVMEIDVDLLEPID